MVSSSALFVLNPHRDVKGIKDQWPNLIDSAPKNIIPDMVQVKQLLIAYSVGIEAEFKGQTLIDVTELVNTAMKTGGSVNFFGYDIGVDVSESYQKTLSTSFQYAKFDAASGRLSIPPTDNGYPVLLAVIGQTRAQLRQWIGYRQVLSRRMMLWPERKGWRR